MEKLSNTKTLLRKSVAYKKVYISTYLQKCDAVPNRKLPSPLETKLADW